MKIFKVANNKMKIKMSSEEFKKFCADNGIKITSKKKLIKNEKNRI